MDQLPSDGSAKFGVWTPLFSRIDTTTAALPGLQTPPAEITDLATAQWRRGLSQRDVPHPSLLHHAWRLRDLGISCNVRHCIELSADEMWQHI
jgi:hypothetical protein